MKVRRSEYPTDSALERLRRFVTGNWERKPKADGDETPQQKNNAEKAGDKRETGKPD